MVACYSTVLFVRRGEADTTECFVVWYTLGHTQSSSGIEKSMEGLTRVGKGSTRKIPKALGSHRVETPQAIYTAHPSGGVLVRWPRQSWEVLQVERETERERQRLRERGGRGDIEQHERGKPSVSFWTNQCPQRFARTILGVFPARGNPNSVSKSRKPGCASTPLESRTRHAVGELLYHAARDKVATPI